MLICDTHCDTLYTRAMHPAAACDITIEKAIQGGINLQTMAMFVGGKDDAAYKREAYQKMKAMTAELKAEGFVQCFSPLDARENVPGFMLSVEGCDLLEGQMELIDEWQALGVRMAALTWNYPNCIGTPAKLNATDRLTPFGRDAVREMIRRGIAPDVSHLNIGGFFDLLDMGAVPLASHSCCYTLCPHSRNLNDDQIRALFDAGGYIGVNFYPFFLNEKGKADLNTVADHILYLLDRGGEGKIGFGSDFDGIEVRPEGLNGPQDLPALLATLRARGVTEEILKGIAGQNLIDYYVRCFGK